MYFFNVFFNEVVIAFMDISSTKKVSINALLSIIAQIYAIKSCFNNVI